MPLSASQNMQKLFNGDVNLHYFVPLTVHHSAIADGHSCHLHGTQSCRYSSINNLDKSVGLSISFKWYCFNYHQ